MAKKKRKVEKPTAFDTRWSRGSYGPVVNFELGVPKGAKKTLFPAAPKTTVGSRPPRKKPILKVTGKGRPDRRIKTKLPVIVPKPKPLKPARGVHVSESRIGGEPIEGPARTLRREWKPSVDVPVDSYIPTDTNLPPGVEAFIHLTKISDGIYPLMRATAHGPDHTHDKALDYWRCKHSRNASSWVSCIGLVVLQSGELALYAAFWDGAEIAYLFRDGDDAIAMYNWWKSEPSKGKAIRGKFGPSRLWKWPYIVLSS